MMNSATATPLSHMNGDVLTQGGRGGTSPLPGGRRTGREDVVPVISVPEAFDEQPLCRPPVDLRVLRVLEV
jgi:hypothetical protein